jgi:hypothetical protein
MSLQSQKRENIRGHFDVLRGQQELFLSEDDLDSLDATKERN